MRARTYECIPWLGWLSVHPDPRGDCALCTPWSGLPCCTPWSGVCVHYLLPDLGWSLVVYFLTISFSISWIVCTFFLGLIVCNVCITRVDWTLLLNDHAYIPWLGVILHCVLSDLAWLCAVYFLTWGGSTQRTVRCIYSMPWSGVTLPCTPWPNIQPEMTVLFISTLWLGVAVRCVLSDLRWPCTMYSLTWSMRRWWAWSGWAGHLALVRSTPRQTPRQPTYSSQQANFSYSIL